MKKIIVIMMLVLIPVSCFNDSDDEGSIEDVVNSLAAAITSDNYTAFRSCFHPDCSYNVSYTETDFNTNLATPYSSYAFTGLNINVDKSKSFGADDPTTASATADAVIDGISGNPTSFQFKKDGDDWRILVWVESGSDMYRIKDETFEIVE